MTVDYKQLVLVKHLGTRCALVYILECSTEKLKFARWNLKVRQMR
jgi:hypothetical protein